MTRAHIRSSTTTSAPTRRPIRERLGTPPDRIADAFFAYGAEWMVRRTSATTETMDEEMPELELASPPFVERLPVTKRERSHSEPPLDFPSVPRSARRRSL
eukprot:GHVR01052280.1.p1 GENE.GHVR01052280.1~~GHVR01052280.1.p1  ORF type:complete len:101 (-),score=15.17 GHVR01052280.1:107-409(-)